MVARARGDVPTPVEVNHELSRRLRADIELADAPVVNSELRRVLKVLHMEGEDLAVAERHHTMRPGLAVHPLLDFDFRFLLVVLSLLLGCPAPSSGVGAFRFYASSVAALAF